MIVILEKKIEFVQQELISKEKFGWTYSLVLINMFGS